MAFLQLITASQTNVQNLGATPMRRSGTSSKNMGKYPQELQGGPSYHVGNAVCVLAGCLMMGESERDLVSQGLKLCATQHFA